MVTFFLLPNPLWELKPAIRYPTNEIWGSWFKKARIKVQANSFT